MSQDPWSDHPDLNDPKWLAEANRAAKKDIRRMRNKARRGPRLRRALTILLLIGILGMGYLMYRGTFSSRPAEQINASPSSPPATTETTMIPDVVVDLNQPFVGTPAAGWADGAAGFVPPAAEPVKGYRAEQVADAYAKVKQVLVEARLDRKVIESHDIEPYLSLLAPDSAADLRPAYSSTTNFPTWATKIADGFRLLRVQPKVSGHMSASVNADGALVVHTDYVVAYAFNIDQPNKLRSAMDVVAVVRAQTDYQVLDERWAKSSQGLFLSESQGYLYSMACGPAKNGFLAPYYSERVDGGPTASRRPEDYFDPNQSLSIENGC